jgi:hypothetical protein
LLLQQSAQGFSVDTKTGAITGTPQRVRDAYTMRLRAVDAADVRTTVANWTFNVKRPPAFELNPSAGWSMEIDGKLDSKYHIAETHLLPKPRVQKAALLRHPANGDFVKVVYLLTVHPAANNPNCTVVDTEDTQVISALTDISTGKGAINIQCEGNYTAKLVARDGGGSKPVDIRSWRFEVLRKDTVVPEYGPGGRGCANGKPDDGEPMDRDFTCDCTGTKFTGDNCEVESASSEQNDTTSYIIVAVFAVLVLAAIVIFLVVRYQGYQRSRMATDFKAQLEQMKEDGLVDAEQISGDRVPRELKRSWLMFIDKLGDGAFGEVWKGLLSDGDYSNTPEYIVAAKTVKEGKDAEGTTVAESELMKEALLMAQVEPHTNLVSIIGVITRGRPKTLVREFVFLNLNWPRCALLFLFLVGVCDYTGVFSWQLVNLVQSTGPVVLRARGTVRSSQKKLGGRQCVRPGHQAPFLRRDCSGHGASGGAQLHPP